MISRISTLYFVANRALRFALETHTQLVKKAQFANCRIAPNPKCSVLSFPFLRMLVSVCEILGFLLADIFTLEHSPDFLKSIRKWCISFPHKDSGKQSGRDYRAQHWTHEYNWSPLRKCIDCICTSVIIFESILHLTQQSKCELEREARKLPSDGEIIFIARLEPRRESVLNVCIPRNPIDVGQEMLANSNATS